MWRIRRRVRTISPGPWPFSRPRVAIEHVDLYGELLDDVHVVIDPVEPAELLGVVEDAVRAEAALSAVR